MWSAEQIVSALLARGELWSVDWAPADVPIVARLAEER